MTNSSVRVVEGVL